MLKKTPLNARHVASGARMVAFGGWDMPVEYSGIADEHLAVRTRAGLFDVSHMGEIEIAGKDALAAVQRISSQRRLEARRSARRSTPALLTPEGTFVDDVLVYRLGADALHARRQRRATSRRTTRWIAEHIKPASATPSPSTRARATRCSRVQGPAALETSCSR